MQLLRTPIAICLCLALLAAALGSASAAQAEEPSWLCIPTKTGGTVTSGGAKGECKAANTAVEVPPPAQMKTLGQILPHISYEASGVAEKPTIRFTGVNVQVVNGLGETETVNGEGNLVIGYAERGTKPKAEQTGSHYLVVGTRQEFTSYGGIIGGQVNSSTGPFATVLGGAINAASGEDSSVLGGELNVASAPSSSVAGGDHNAAEGFRASVAGGRSNTSAGLDATVSGGEDNAATAAYSWVGGGYKNLAEGELSAIFGGKELTAKEEYEAIP